MKNLSRAEEPEALTAAPVEARVVELRPRRQQPSTTRRRPKPASPTKSPAVPVPAAAGPLPQPAPVPQAPTPLKAWDPGEQPRERLMRYGPETLATSELIAILLRTGTAQANVCDVARELVAGADGRLRELGTRDWRDLARVHGVGPVKAVTLVAALELGRRREVEADVERPTVIGSAAAFAQVRPVLADLPHEECWVLLLNNASRMLGRERLSAGGLDGTVVDVRALMALCLRFGATAFVLAHNHPSGGLDPSDADVAMTQRVAEAGRVMRIELRDHLVVGGRRYYSFRDGGRL